MRGRWRYLYRAIDRDGALVDVMLSEHRDQNAFALICTGGAIGKCVRWGYKPWRSGPDGVALWDYHQACVRMVRADYGGDGVGHTRDNTPVDVFDRLEH